MFTQTSFAYQLNAYGKLELNTKQVKAADLSAGVLVLTLTSLKASVTITTDKEPTRWQVYSGLVGKLPIGREVRQRVKPKLFTKQQILLLCLPQGR